jgi:hypothetical protein
MKEFTFTFTEQDLNTLNMALLEMPTKYGAPLIEKINRQIQEQFDNSVDAADLQALPARLSQKAICKGTS